MLFIDSSHVAKVGSDVAHLFLRVLPRPAHGVLVHVHDICYPFSYPLDWLKQGRAFNESLLLRAFLIGNSQFEVVAFNSYAKRELSYLFAERLPEIKQGGSSIWLRKVS